MKENLGKGFFPEDGKDTAEEAECFLLDQRSQKMDAANRLIAVLEDPKSSEPERNRAGVALELLSKEDQSGEIERRVFPILILHFPIKYF